MSALPYNILIFVVIERELAETRDIGVGWIKLSSLFNKVY